MTTASIRPLLASLLGPLLWAAHLFVLYGAEAIACAISGGAAPRFALVTTAIVTSVCCLAILLADLLRRRSAASQSDAFLARLAAGLSLLSAIGILWNAYPALALAPCRVW